MNTVHNPCSTLNDVDDDGDSREEQMFMKWSPFTLFPPPLLVHSYSATNSLFENDDLCWATRWVHADSHWRAIKSNQIPTCSQFIPNSSSQNVTFICIGFLDLLPIPTAWILAIVKLYSHNSTKATTIITPLSTSVNGNGTEINLACSLLV